MITNSNNNCLEWQWIENDNIRRQCSYWPKLSCFNVVLSIKRMDTLMCSEFNFQCSRKDKVNFNRNSHLDSNLWTLNMNIGYWTWYWIVSHRVSFDGMLFCVFYYNSIWFSARETFYFSFVYQAFWTLNTHWTLDTGHWIVNSYCWSNSFESKWRKR